jgi:hypothetical protein
MPPPANREPILLVIIAALVLALTVVMSLSFWGLTLQVGRPVDYARFGNWSDAIAGLGTLLTVVAAAAAIVGDRFATRRAEQAERERSETDVHHWLDYAEVRDERDRHIGWRWTIHIQNRTQAPLYEWVADFPELNQSINNKNKSPLKPGESFFNLPFLDDLAPSAAPTPMLMFRDRSARWWQRSAHGSVGPWSPPAAEGVGS